MKKSVLAGWRHEYDRLLKLKNSDASANWTRLLPREIRGQNQVLPRSCLRRATRRIRPHQARPPARKFSAARTDGRWKNGNGRGADQSNFRRGKIVPLRYVGISNAGIARPVARREAGRDAAIWARCANARRKDHYYLTKRRKRIRACWTSCCNCSTPRASRWRRARRWTSAASMSGSLPTSAPPN